MIVGVCPPPLVDSSDEEFDEEPDEESDEESNEQCANLVQVMHALHINSLHYPTGDGSTLPNWRWRIQQARDRYNIQLMRRPMFEAESA